jgi:hypothetical protein
MAIETRSSSLKNVIFHSNRQTIILRDANTVRCQERSSSMNLSIYKQGLYVGEPPYLEDLAAVLQGLLYSGIP